MCELFKRGCARESPTSQKSGCDIFDSMPGPFDRHFESLPRVESGSKLLVFSGGEEPVVLFAVSSEVAQTS